MLKPGNGDRHEGPGSRGRTLFVYVVVLSSSTVLFFLGGFLLRNPNAVTYLGSAIQGWWNSPAPVPSASPRTPAEYLELLHRNLTELPPDQKAIARGLIAIRAKISETQSQLNAIEQTVQVQLPLLKTAEALTAYATLRDKAAKLLNSAGDQIVLLGDLKDRVSAELKTHGLSNDLARQVASLFCESVDANRARNQAVGLQRFAGELLATASLLMETPGQWVVSSSGVIHSKDRKLDEEYQAHLASLEAVMGGVRSEK